jgi:16S rRNA (uracil1498-N3)-methyltransferase
MRILRAFVPLQSLDIKQLIELPTTTSHHLANVLRVQKGDMLQLFDGKGHRFSACITALGKRLSVEILDALPSDTESPLAIQLFIAVGKGDKMDWIVQKATELGVTSIQPISCVRSVVQLSEERWQKKQNHWQEIAVNACEQSGLDVVPQLCAVTSFNKALQTAQNQLNLVLHPGEGSQKMKQLIPEMQVTTASLFIGPEGGFTQEELALAQTRGFRLASLGPRILRMETAAISSITLLQALLGDI